MKHLLLLLLLALPVAAAHAQPVNWKKVDAAVQAESAAAARHTRPAKVLLLGTFHFNYPNQDSHKIDSSKMIDVLSPQRQAEVQQVLEVIQKFGPTRIYLEVQEHRQPRLDSLYQAYRSGSFMLGRNEIFQLGFRAAAALKHPKVYAADDDNFANEHYRRLPLIDSLWSQRKAVDAAHGDSWNAFYKRHYTRSDSLALHRTLLETFLVMAEPQSLRLSHGDYITGHFNSTDDKGPDALALHWYSRNLRVYNNILKTKPGPEDRILVIFGAGHMPVLQHLFGSSPEFEVVSLRSVVQEPGKKKITRR